MSLVDGHPKTEGRKLLRDGQRQGWKVERGGKYFKMYCPCPDKHKATNTFDSIEPELLEREATATR